MEESLSSENLSSSTASPPLTSIGFDNDELQESFAQRMFNAALTVDKYYTPLLFLFGTLGNSLSVTVFCMNAKYRSQSASYYLSALAISDTGFLINLLAVWLENVHGGVITSGLMCPLVMYLGQVTCFMSVYLTVAFSIERYIAVHYPLSRPRICTRSKARKVIAALTGVALLVFSYAWVIAQVIEMPFHREDYDEMYQDTPPERGKWNTSISTTQQLQSQQESLELLSSFLPVENRVKREDIFPLPLHVSYPSYPQQQEQVENLPTPYKQITETELLTNVFDGREKDCGGYGGSGGNRNQTFYNESLLPSLLQEALNESYSSWSWNCGGGGGEEDAVAVSEARLYSDDGTIFQNRLDKGSSQDDFGGSSSTSSGESSTSVEENNTGRSDAADGAGTTATGASVVPTTEENFLSGGFICSVPKDYYKISEIANYLDSVVTLIIPFFLITFFNVRIAFCVWKLRDQRQSIVATSSSSSATTAARTEINHYNNSNTSLRCSTKNSLYFQKNSTTTTNNSRTDGDGGNGMKQHHHHLSNKLCEKSSPAGNGVILKTTITAPTPHSDDNQSYNSSSCNSKPKKGIIKFRGGPPTSNINDSCSSSSANSEENTCIMDDDDGKLSPMPRSSSNNQRVMMMKGISSDENSTKFCDRSPQLSSTNSSAKGLKITWAQDQEVLPSRLPMKPELSLVRERATSNIPSSSAAEARVTKTLLLVSTVFLVLNLPAHAIRCALFIQSLRGTSEGSDFLHAAQPWTNILFNTNFAVNFLLYCVSGRNFRKSLRNIILRKFSGSSNSSSASSWRPIKTFNKKKNDHGHNNHPRSKQVVVGGGGPLSKQLRHSTKSRELQVTEIIELEDRRNEEESVAVAATSEPVFPIPAAAVPVSSRALHHHAAGQNFEEDGGNESMNV